MARIPIGVTAMNLAMAIYVFAMFILALLIMFHQGFRELAGSDMGAVVITVVVLLAPVLTLYVGENVNQHRRPRS